MSRLSITREPEVIVRNTEPFILTSESFEDYSNSLKYIEALYEEVQNQHELNRFMSECLILVENSSPYVKMQKLRALNEEDTLAIGDKSSSNTGWFDKIMNFIKKIWGKFVEKITRWITTNNYYLEKYKDIILKKQPKIGSIQLNGDALDFDAAQDRIMRVVINPGKTIDIAFIKGLPPIDEQQNANATDFDYADTLIPNFTKDVQNKQIEFKSWCTDFFEGKAGTGVVNAKNEYNSVDLKWANMYNFCHDANNIVNAIKKDQELLQKECSAVVNALSEWYKTFKTADANKRASMNTAAGEVGTAYNTMQTNAAAKTVNVNTASFEGEAKKAFDADPAVKNWNEIRNKKVDVASKTVPDLANKLNPKQYQDAAQYKQAADAFNAEYTKRQAAYNNALPKFQKMQDQQNLNAARKKQGEVNAQPLNASAILSTVYNIYLTEDNLSNQLKSNANVRTTNTAVTTGASNAATDDTTGAEAEKEKNMYEKKGQKFSNIGVAILSSKMTATEFIYSQYMKIIRAHVESYVGQPVDSSSNKAAVDQTGNNYQQEPAQPIQQTGNDITPQIRNNTPPT